MTAVQCLITAAAILLGTLATRFAPFVLLPKNRPVPRLVEYLGGTLPYAAMGLLVVYCLKDVAWLSGTHGAPELISIALTAGLIFIASMFFISSFFIRSIIEPVTEITATAKRIAAGSYGVQIPKHYDDEIGELADTINDMSVKIGQSEKTQSEFMSSVSHELRTPLTAISGWGETLLSSGNLEPETRRGMLIILREAKRLTGMVEELLEFTRMQDGRFTLTVEKADLLAEFEDPVFMYGSRLKQEGIALDKRKVVIDPIKTTGVYTAKCKLGYEITADLKVEVREL